MKAELGAVWRAYVPSLKVAGEWHCNQGRYVMARYSHPQRSQSIRIASSRLRPSPMHARTANSLNEH